MALDILISRRGEKKNAYFEGVSVKPGENDTAVSVLSESFYLD